MKKATNHFDYALSNPIANLLNKAPQEFSRKDMLRIFEEKHSERIGFHYTALDGKLKELKIPISNPYQLETILAEGERVDGSSLFKGMVDASVSDLYVVPLYRSVFLNPLIQAAWILCAVILPRMGNWLLLLRTIFFIRPIPSLIKRPVWTCMRSVNLNSF
jgi:glutamine synthetase